ncbi:MAG: hypothetical protein IJ811_03715 [Clostridia bacterium]|nr:hypothetical protein [Clostridia bacterium]
MKPITIQQTRELIESAQKAKETGIGLTKVFAEFAEKTGRAKGSVRNYYYQLCKRARDNKSVLQVYPTLADANVKKNQPFSTEQERRLVDEISEGVRLGKSVRRVVFELARGDHTLALRYQNKYRNVISKRKAALYADRTEELKQLSTEINGLVERIGESLRRENFMLKRRVEQLLRENTALKSALDR